MKVMGGTHPVCYSTINKRSCEGILLTPVSWSLHISFKVNRISSRYTFQLVGQEIEVHWYIEGTPVEILIWKAVDLLLPKTFNLLVSISREKTDVKYCIENGRIPNHCSCFAFSPLSPLQDWSRGTYHKVFVKK